MDKEIPFSKEKPSKAERLREVSRHLQDFPLDRPLSETEWNQTTEDLTKDDLEHLRKLAAGHQERAAEAAAQGHLSEALEEAAAAILLWPNDAAWARKTAEIFGAGAGRSPEKEDFLRSLNRRVGKRARFAVPRWLWALAILAASVALGVGAIMTFWQTEAPEGSGPALGPRTLETNFDTQGIKPIFRSFKAIC